MAEPIPTFRVVKKLNIVRVRSGLKDVNKVAYTEGDTLITRQKTGFVTLTKEVKDLLDNGTLVYATFPETTYS